MSDPSKCVYISILNEDQECQADVVFGKEVNISTSDNFLLDDQGNSLKQSTSSGNVTNSTSNVENAVEIIQSENNLTSLNNVVFDDLEDYLNDCNELEDLDSSTFAVYGYTKSGLKRRRPVKTKKYEMREILDDDKEERKRKNAIQAKIHRDSKKKAFDDLKKENETLKKENEILNSKLSQIKAEKETVQSKLDNAENILATVHQLVNKHGSSCQNKN